MVKFGQSGYNWVKVVAFVKKWLYSGKSCFIRAKVVVFGQSGCILAKVFVLGQSGCFLGKRVCILAKVVVFWQKWF